MDHQIISKAVLANVFGVSRAAITKNCKGMNVVDYAKVRILRYFAEESGENFENIKETRSRLESAFKKEYRKRCGSQKRIQGRPPEAYNIKDALDIIEDVYTTIQKHMKK